MSLSVTAPLDQAFKRTATILFRPFEASKWFKLGFCAFLVQLADCGGGGGGANLRNLFDGSGQSFGRQTEEFSNWFARNQALILSLGLIAVLFFIAFLILLVWLQSRGRFMLLDGVVHDRGAISAPWHEYRSEGNSLFRFALVLTFSGALLSLLAVGVGVALAWSDLHAERFAGGALAGLILGGGLLLLSGVTFTLLNLITNDFVVPAMYARRVGVLQAWRAVLDEVLRPNLGTLVLYVLVKIGIAIASGVVAIALMCGTIGVACCILAIPYIGTVLLLPLFVFDRSYSIAFLQQLGSAWTLGPTPGTPPATVAPAA